MTAKPAIESGKPPSESMPADYCDPVIEAYKKHINRSLLRENLKLNVQDRLEKIERFMKTLEESRRARQLARAAQVRRGN